jgi:hypothetical protein
MLAIASQCLTISLENKAKIVRSSVVLHGYSFQRTIFKYWDIPLAYIGPWICLGNSFPYGHEKYREGDSSCRGIRIIVGLSFYLI